MELVMDIMGRRLQTAKDTMLMAKQQHIVGFPLEQGCV
jgi:hypothetical protein